MMKPAFFILVAWSTALFAQDANKIADFVHSALDARSREIIAATVDMPADRFGFRPSPPEMSFGQLTLHVADTNYLYCSTIGGVPDPALPKIPDSDTKEKLVQRLKASFDFCASALARIAEADKSQTLMIGPAKTSRAMAILTLTGTWTDHVALQATYLKPAATPGPTAGR
jgi:hypothetical protein